MKNTSKTISRYVRKICLALAFGLMALVVTVLAMDTDNNGLPDDWEHFFGLCPTNAADVGLDYDGDALYNIEESKLLTDPFYWDTDRDGFSDLIDSNAVSRAYIRWGDPQFTTGDQYEYAHPDWLLGAYKDGGEWVVDTATTQSCWYVSVYGSNLPAVSTPQALQAGGVGMLSIDLDRSILTNNLRYAVHYEGRAAQPVRPSDSVGQGCPTLPSLYVDLLDTNGVIVVEDLYGNLMTGSNVDSTIILNVPTAKFPDAAVIQLRCGKTGDLSGEALAKTDGEIIVYEGLLYIDEDGDGLDADQEKQIGTSDYSVDSNGNGISDYDEAFKNGGGSSTNNPNGGDSGGDDDGKDGDKDKNKGIIYVDQAKGNDAFTGRASVPTSQSKGPKKTVHGGLSIAETNDTIIIRSGVYNENLDIRGKDVKVFIEGNVRL